MMSVYSVLRMCLPRPPKKNHGITAAYWIIKNHYMSEFKGEWR